MIMIIMMIIIIAITIKIIVIIIIIIVIRNKYFMHLPLIKLMSHEYSRQQCS